MVRSLRALKLIKLPPNKLLLMIFIVASISPTRCQLAYVVTTFVMAGPTVSIRLWQLIAIWVAGVICMYHLDHTGMLIASISSVMSCMCTCIFVLAPHTVHSIP